jgi:DNA-binding transcriptional ArsR family regulator
MVQHPSTLDRTFSALSDPTRRGILERLGPGSATISDLAAGSGMSLTGLQKHVRILEQAGLVATEKRGRTRHCHLGPKRLDDVSDWIEDYRRFWDASYERLDEYLETLKEKEGRQHGHGK